MNPEKYLKEPLGHELITIPLIKKYFDKPIIFDVGSCDGLDSIRYSRIYAESTVYAFEANPNNFKNLQDNIKDIPEIKAFNIALAKNEGEINFYPSYDPQAEINSIWDSGNKSGSIFPPKEHLNLFRNINFSPPVKLKCSTLTNVFEENQINRISLLHIDVQGAELEVLKGGQKSLKYTDFIWVEVSKVELYEGQPLVHEIEDFFKLKGFTRVINSIKGAYGDQLYINKTFYSKLNLLEKLKIKLISIFNGLF